MVLNFLNKGAAINVLARLHNVQLRVVDVGVDADFELETGGRSELIHHKIARGTANMLLEPAMTEEQVSLALDLGAQLAKDAADAGHNIVAIGEMGIGNTTAASAITCALCGVSATVATGRGTGVSPESYARKIEVVSAVIAKHFDGGNPHPLEILRKVGGLEIAAMTGVVLSAARHKLVVVADGFISTTAAALAVAIEPKARGYIVVGHRSEEPGHKLLLDYLDATPVLAMNMRLGEGTGAVLAMPILESAMCLYSQMATFASAGVSEAS
jgi:nicotinate-nucleotide--dimethylbenzimidazole phosphoribosyltransferase